MPRFLPALAASLLALVGAKPAAPEPFAAVPMPDLQRRYATHKRSRARTNPSGYELERRIRHNRTLLDAARAKTAKLQGNPPGYTYAHRDRLARLVGARGANKLEEGILERRISFARALEIAEQVA